MTSKSKKLSNSGLVSKIFGEWYHYLQLSDHSRLNLITNIVETLNKKYLRYTDIYPKKRDVFRIFREFESPRDVRVVILGGVPYTDDRANGIAYANSIGSPQSGMCSPTLKNIVEFIKGNLIEEYKYEFSKSVGFDITLSHWLEQGVIPLHTSLTTQSSNEDFHSYMWESFIRILLNTISTYNNGVIFVLLGDKARKLQTSIVNASSIVMLGDSMDEETDGFQSHGADIFNKVNDFLKDNNNEVIRW